MKARARLSASYSIGTTTLHESDSDISRSVLGFLEDSSIHGADEMRSLLVQQKEAAELRLQALRLLSDYLSVVQRPDLVLASLSRLSLALKNADPYKVQKHGSVLAERSNHFLDLLPAVGSGLKQALADAYFGLVVALTKAKREGAALPMELESAVLELCNLDLTPADLAQLQHISIVSFVAPLIRITVQKAQENNPAAMQALEATSVAVAEEEKKRKEAADSRDAPLFLRYGAFTLFRLLSYLAAASATAQVGAHELADSLFAELFSQLFDLIALREEGITTRQQEVERKQKEGSQEKEEKGPKEEKGGASRVFPVPWDKVEARTHFEDVGVAWYRWNLEENGLMYQPQISTPVSPHEATLLLNQLLWVVMRACRQDDTHPAGLTLPANSIVCETLAHDAKWVNLLLAAAGLPSDGVQITDPSPSTRLLAFLTLRRVLPVTSPALLGEELCEQLLSFCIETIAKRAVGNNPAELEVFMAEQCTYLLRSLLHIRSETQRDRESRQRNAAAKANKRGSVVERSSSSAVSETDANSTPIAVSEYDHAREQWRQRTDDLLLSALSKLSKCVKSQASSAREAAAALLVLGAHRPVLREGGRVAVQAGPDVSFGQLIRYAPERVTVMIQQNDKDDVAVTVRLDNGEVFRSNDPASVRPVDDVSVPTNSLSKPFEMARLVVAALPKLLEGGCMVLRQYALGALRVLLQESAIAKDLASDPGVADALASMAKLPVPDRSLPPMFSPPLTVASIESRLRFLAEAATAWSDGRGDWSKIPRISKEGWKALRSGADPAVLSSSMVAEGNPPGDNVPRTLVSRNREIVTYDPEIWVRAGAWYYEATLVPRCPRVVPPDGALRIGWMLHTNYSSDVVGDVSTSWAFDLGDASKHSNYVMAPYGKVVQPGQVVGTLLRIDETGSEIRFFIDGEDLGVAYSELEGFDKKKFIRPAAAISCQQYGLRIVFNPTQLVYYNKVRVGNSVAYCAALIVLVHV